MRATGVIEPSLKPAATEDLTGQTRFARNVAVTWGGYLINIAAGFIMPRLISDRLGQTTLGIWDFCWSMVASFGLVQLGLSGSVQRYVAKYRAERDPASLSKSVSTIGLSLNVSGCAAILLSAVAAILIVPLFQARLGGELTSARLIVFVLGLEIAFSVLLTVYGGILVGCHRWDAHNLISAVCYGVMTVGMIAALLAGGGLVSLAVVHCVAMTAGEIARWWMSRRVCPEFVMDYRLANWKDWIEQARYSGKSLIPRLADLISNQVLALLLTAFLGPAMLAIYSRPRNLMRQGQSVAAKFGSILIPTASSLHAQADSGQLRTTFLKSTGFLSLLAMPGVAALAIFGDELIRLWMGGAYIYRGLVPVLAIGCFPSLIQEPVWSILSGMNQHGLLAAWKLAASICSAATLGVGLAVFHWKLIGAALALALPQLLIDGIIAPVIACRLLQTPCFDYYRETYLRPLLGTASFVCALAVADQNYKGAPAIAIAAGAVAAVILTMICLKAFSALRHASKK